MFSLCDLQAEDRKVLWSAETEVKLTLLPRLFRQPSPERRLTADRWAACVLWYRLFCFSVKFFFWMQRCLLVFPVRFLASYRCILRMGAGISMSGLPSSAIATPFRKSLARFLFERRFLFCTILEVLLLRLSGFRV